MYTYEVHYYLREELINMSESAKRSKKPHVFRTGASNATRAISACINNLKDGMLIHSKSDVAVIEARVVA